MSRIDGFRADSAGADAKRHLVRTHVAAINGDLLRVLCALHKRKVISLAASALVEQIRFTAPAAGGGSKESGAVIHPGAYLASVLRSCPQEQAHANVQAYLEFNPTLDAVDQVDYLAAHGFVKYDTNKLLEEGGAVTWQPQGLDATPAARWRSAWETVCSEVPSGKTWYATLAKQRGGKCQVAFLGSSTPDSPNLMRPKDLMRMWKLPPPSMLVTADAGSMHPTQCDSINRMAHLPQFHEYAPHGPNATASDARK